MNDVPFWASSCPRQGRNLGQSLAVNRVLVSVSLVDDLRARNAALTSAELCELINLHPVTLREWTRGRRIPGYRMGREYRYDPHTIANWLEEHEIR